MPSRTPSFIVVGLVLIMLLLGFFYMSCSSTTAELRQTLDEFEERIRSLTMKNSDNEKKIETMNTSHRELEEEKLNIQKQMEKKDSEINDLNTKLNEKNAEIQSFKSDKQVLEEQLKELRTMSDTLAAKNSVIEKLQQQYDEQKKSNERELNDLRQQIETYKQQLNQPQEKLSIISNQRFQPLLSSNETNRSSSSLSQQPLTNPNSNIGNNSISIQTNNAQQVDQNQPVQNVGGQGQINLDIHQRLQRSLSNSNITNKTQIDIDNAQKTVLLTSTLPFNRTNIVNNEPQLLMDIKDNHEQLQLDKNDIKNNNLGEEDDLNKQM